MKGPIGILSNLLLLTLVPFAAIQISYCRAQSALSPRDQLQQYVTQLQANPSDDALRTKIIQSALTLNPKPTVPDEAAVDAAKGMTFFTNASSPDDERPGWFSTTPALWRPDRCGNSDARRKLWENT